MKAFFKKTRTIIMFPLVLPSMVAFLLSSNKDKIMSDLKRYYVAHSLKWGGYYNALIICMLEGEKAFRNIFYYRVGLYSHLFKIFLPENNTCHITCPDIGSGLFIQHGDATYISAKKIGNNCWVNQCVTIGYKNRDDAPTIGNNVTVSSGAKIIGKVNIGNNVVIGANAVVVKDVPDNCTVVGVPAYIIKLNGIKCNIQL